MERLRFRPYFTTSPENGMSMRRERTSGRITAREQSTRAEREWARKKGDVQAEGPNCELEKGDRAIMICVRRYPKCSLEKQK